MLTVEDAAVLLRTTKRAIYAMIERRQLRGIVRTGRRVLLRSDDLLSGGTRSPRHRNGVGDEEPGVGIPRHAAWLRS